MKQIDVRKDNSDQVTIDKHITDILKNILKVPEDRIKKIEQTSNTYGFFGILKTISGVSMVMSERYNLNFGVSGTTGKT